MPPIPAGSQPPVAADCPSPPPRQTLARPGPPPPGLFHGRATAARRWGAKLATTSPAAATPRSLIPDSHSPVLEGRPNVARVETPGFGLHWPQVPERRSKLSAPPGAHFCHFATARLGASLRDLAARGRGPGTLAPGYIFSPAPGLVNGRATAARLRTRPQNSGTILSLALLESPSASAPWRPSSPPGHWKSVPTPPPPPPRAR